MEKTNLGYMVGKRKMTEEDWIWMPHPGHFCASYDCRFILNTYVNGYVISTVGEWVPDSRRKGEREESFETIGLGRLYETVVFKAKKNEDLEHQCCPYLADLDSDNFELDFKGYNDPTLAFKGHYDLCDKWSKK